MSDKKYGAPPPEPESYPAQEPDETPLRERPSYQTMWCNVCKGNTKHRTEYGYSGSWFCTEPHGGGSPELKDGFYGINPNAVPKPERGHMRVTDTTGDFLKCSHCLDVVIIPGDGEPEWQCRCERTSVVRSGRSAFSIKGIPEPERTKND